MNQKIQELLEDNFTIKVCQAFISILFIYIAIIVWKWKALPPELPLFYSLPRSTDQLASPIQLLILPFFSLLIFLVHFIFAVFVNPSEKIAAKILLTSALVTSIAFLLTFIRIIILIS